VDLLKPCGNADLREIAGHFRCEQCQRKDCMSANWQNVYGPDVGTVKVRRLVRVRMTRVCDWEEGTL
jgi:hypothetical protein